jgi:hypothetical protein
MSLLLLQDIRKKYKFCIVRCPYELMPYSPVSEMFPKIIRLKTEGYRKEYDQHVLPFDSSDFIATHLLLCEKGSNEELRPVLGFKSVTLKKCDDHRINFPMLGMLENTQSDPMYKKVVSSILDEYRRNSNSANVAYNGSFTILPELREDKVLMKYLWDITFSLLTNYYIDYSINHVLAVCATKFNVHKKKETLGWNFINAGNEELGPYHCSALFGAELVPMELKDVKAKSSESSEKFKDMWEEKIILDLENLQSRKIAA